MKKIYTFIPLIAIFFFSNYTFSQVNVTLRLDMTGQTISTNGVHVVGSINNWNTSSLPLTQEGTTNIYSTTIQLNTGWHEYKFLNGNDWGTEESAGFPCAASNGNRFLYINDSGNNVVLEPVPFNGCNAEGTGFSFTLNVDLENEVASSSGVKVAGWFNGWNGDNFTLPNVVNNIHSGTLRLPTPSDYPIIFEYKYVNGSSWETPDNNCNTVVNTNRFQTLTASGMSIFNVFNGCNYTLSLQNSFNADVNVYYKKNDGLILTSTNNYSQLTIQLFDMLGKKVLTENISKINKTNINIRLNNINSGLYILKISDDLNRIKTKKILLN
jgi:hypothetical protein